jgi:hypothetical protein
MKTVALGSRHKRLVRAPKQVPGAPLGAYQD